MSDLPFDPEEMLARLTTKMVAEVGKSGSVPATKVARQLIAEHMMREVPVDHERRMATDDPVELARYLGSLGETDRQIGEEFRRRLSRPPSKVELATAALGRRDLTRLVRRLQIESFRQGRDFRTTSWMRGDG